MNKHEETNGIRSCRDFRLCLRKSSRKKSWEHRKLRNCRPADVFTNQCTAVRELGLRMKQLRRMDKDLFVLVSKMQQYFPSESAVEHASRLCW